MTLTKWRGVRPKNTNFRSLDSFLGDTYRQMLNWQGPDADDISLPAANVREDNSAFHLEIAAPGYKKEDFDISIDNGVLTIHAEHKVDEKEMEDTYTRREFRYGGFTRKFSLPESAQEEYIKARYEDGILKMEIPREKELEDEGKPRKVLIQ